MFRIYANSNFINEVLGYSNAINLAYKTKKMFGKNSIVIIEDIKGRIVNKL